MPYELIISLFTNLNAWCRQDDDLKLSMGMLKSILTYLSRSDTAASHKLVFTNLICKQEHTGYVRSKYPTSYQ